jgi:hypothetical protein
VFGTNDGTPIYAGGGQPTKPATGLGGRIWQVFAGLFSSSPPAYREVSPLHPMQRLPLGGSAGSAAQAMPRAGEPAQQALGSPPVMVQHPR